MDVRLKPNVATAQLRQPNAPSDTATPAPVETVEQVKDTFQDQADIHNFSRHAGNKVSEVFTGVVGHVGGNVALVPSTVKETYRNLWRAETIGPYAKAVGSVIALAGIPLVAGGALIASPFVGAAEAAHGHPYDEAEKPLVSGDTSQVADRITNSKDGPSTLLGKAIKNMQGFGDKKLPPGEEPWDIPVNKIFKGALDGLNFLMVKVPVKVAKGLYHAGKATYKAGKTAVVETAKFTKTYGPKLAMAAGAGLVSTMIAGPAGLAIGIGVSAVLAGRDIKHAITDKDRSFGSRVGGVAKTLAYLPVGPVMAGISIKENFGRSFAEGWDGQPVEAIKTTGKAVMAKAREALHAHDTGGTPKNNGTENKDGNQ